MKINFRIFKTLFKKDFRNCFVNKNVLLMLFLPLVFCILYNSIFGDIEELAQGFVTILCLTLCLSIIPLNILANMVAEEKEKHTLRSLMMAKVSAADFLCSKAAVALLLLVIDSVLVFLLCGENISLLGYFVVFVCLSAIGLLFFGALVGLIAKDQMNAGTISSPLMFILLIPTMFSGLNNFLATVSVAFPTTSLKTLYFALIQQQSLLSKDSLIAIAVCIIWIVIGFIAFLFIYKKRGLDD